jgi:hypothetical protein
VPDNHFLTDLALAGDLVAEDFDGWPDWLKTEFDDHADDGHVGSRLLSQNAKVRVWEIRLAPGQRWHAHRHVLDYFWTAVTPGRSRQHARWRRRCSRREPEATRTATPHLSRWGGLASPKRSLILSSGCSPTRPSTSQGTRFPSMGASVRSSFISVGRGRACAPSVDAAIPGG